MPSKIIEQMEKEGIGLERDGQVRLVPHNPSWVLEFSKEAHRVSSALQIHQLRFHHVGSTAIPGIHAKPVIDILVTAPSLDGLDSRQHIFERLGYEYKGE